MRMSKKNFEDSILGGKNKNIPLRRQCKIEYLAFLFFLFFIFIPNGLKGLSTLILTDFLYSKLSRDVMESMNFSCFDLIAFIQKDNAVCL